MAIVCAWCLAVLDADPGNFTPRDPKQTHGICCSCRRKLEERGAPFLAVSNEKIRPDFKAD